MHAADDGQSGVTFQDRADSSGATIQALWRRPPVGDVCPVELAVIDAPWGVRAGAVMLFRAPVQGSAEVTVWLAG
jgi:hypothetical protein